MGEEWKQYPILIVDDEPNICSQIELELMLEGIKNVKTATRPAEGLEILKSVPAKLVISDQVMPGGMYGTEFLAEVKKLYPDVVTMMLTAHDEPQTIKDATNEAKVFCYLMKPWGGGDHLLEKVTEALKFYHESVGAKTVTAE